MLRCNWCQIQTLTRQSGWCEIHTKKATIQLLQSTHLCVRRVGHYNVFVIEKHRCCTKTWRLESCFHLLFTKVVIVPVRFKFRLALCVSFCLRENTKPAFVKLKTVNFNSREEIFTGYYIRRSDRCKLSSGCLGNTHILRANILLFAWHFSSPVGAGWNAQNWAK